MVPRSAAIETLVEYTHRATSGLALLAVVGLAVWARRVFPAGHRVRTGAALSLAFICVEALLGAGLVMFELVTDNASTFRALSMVAHLVNTFILVAALTLTAWWASGGQAVDSRRNPFAGILLGSAVLGLLSVGATGAIAALGDTLFPSASLTEGLRDSFSSDSPTLIQLRKFHPLLAILLGLYVVAVTRVLARRVRTATVLRYSAILTSLYLGQIFVGAVNIVLLAPVAMQLIHLLLAQGVWMALIFFAAAVLGTPDPPSLEESGGRIATARGAA
jgi:heme A synthase